MAQAETQLGFELPSFLSRVYLEVGNGGFGPGYGLFPLNTHSSSIDSLVTAYLSMRSMSQEDIDDHWTDEEEKPVLWPERVLMLCDWGCNTSSCLDCSSSDLPIFRMDSNVSFVEWAIEAASFQQWLAMWADGKPLFHLNWKQATKVSASHLGKAFSHREHINVSLSAFLPASISIFGQISPSTPFSLSPFMLSLKVRL